MFNEQFLNDHIWFILAIWLFDYILKAIALWIAARKEAKAWFILILILNTVGILPLAYIFYFSKQERNNPRVNS